MYPYHERDIGEINELHRKVHKYFWFSVPGALWAIERLTIGGFGEKLLHISTADFEPLEGTIMGIALILWGIPFEQSEGNLAKMKQSIRDYMIRSGEKKTPIEYTHIDRGVNFVMRFLFDKTPLP